MSDMAFNVLPHMFYVFYAHLYVQTSSHRTDRGPETWAPLTGALINPHIPAGKRSLAKQTPKPATKKSTDQIYFLDRDVTYNPRFVDG